MVTDLRTYRLRHAMERAGRLLAIRARTRVEMVERLADAGFDAEVVARTVDRLEELGLLEDAGLDESAHATELAWRLLRRHAGKPLDQQAAKVMAALLRKGFSEEASREAVRTVLPPEGWD